MATSSPLPSPPLQLDPILAWTFCFGFHETWCVYRADLGAVQKVGVGRETLLAVVGKVQVWGPVLAGVHKGNHKRQDDHVEGLPRAVARQSALPASPVLAPVAHKAVVCGEDTPTLQPNAERLRPMNAPKKKQREGVQEKANLWRLLTQRRAPAAYSEK